MNGLLRLPSGNLAVQATTGGNGPVSAARIVKTAVIVLTLVILALVVAGCSESPNFFRPESPEGRDIANLGYQIFIILSVVLLSVWGILIAMRYFPSARPGGMGDTFRKQCGKPQLILGSLAALWAVLLLSGLSGLPLLAIVPALTFLFSLWLKRLLGGLTGDSYGAVCEIVELTTLFFFAAL